MSVLEWNRPVILGDATLTINLVNFRWLKISIIFELGHVERGLDIRFLSCHKALWFYLGLMVAGYGVALRISPRGDSDG